MLIFGVRCEIFFVCFFFFNDTATTEIYTLSLHDALPIPIVTGEALYTKEQFAQCLAMRAADILNPDICAIGGISALMDISDMAQPHAVVMSPHNYNSPLIGMAATVHVSAVIPNFRITEYYVNFEDICRDIATV